MSCILPRRRSSLLLVRNPTVGGNAGIVEDIVWELDNGIDKVILQQIAADVALGLSGIACKER